VQRGRALRPISRGLPASHEIMAQQESVISQYGEHCKSREHPLERIVRSTPYRQGKRLAATLSKDELVKDGETYRVVLDRGRQKTRRGSTTRRQQSSSLQATGNRGLDFGLLCRVKVLVFEFAYSLA